MLHNSGSSIVKIFWMRGKSFRTNVLILAERKASSLKESVIMTWNVMRVCKQL